MLQARIDAYHEILKNQTRDQLIDSALYYYVESAQVSEELSHLKETQQEMILQYSQMRDELSGARKEISALREQNRHLTGVRDIQDKNLFGRSSEKADVLMQDALSGSTHPDPLSEDADCDQSDNSPDDHDIKPLTKHPFKPGTENNRKKKTKGKREKDLENLPRQTVYDYDIDQLNELYGEGNWRFAFWSAHRSVEIVRSYSYLKVVYTPIISHGLDHALDELPYYGSLYPKSLVSTSLFSTVVTDKYDMYLPVNRQVSAPERFGVPFSRQTMTNWIVKLTLELLKPIYSFLKELLVSYEYQQCDETTYLVIHSGKKSGSKGYIWVVRSSSLLDEPQIILYTYDNSRSADFLRTFYEDISSHIYLSCDAYSAYPAFEKDNSENVTLCGCFMHARRRMADAMRILNTKNLSLDQIQLLPEIRAINILKNIYHEEGLLKDLSAEDRLAGRLKKVKPYVDEYFTFIHGLDPSNPLYSDKLKDAILYSIHQEEELKMFLTDGNIPIDNGPRNVV